MASAINWHAGQLSQKFWPNHTHESVMIASTLSLTSSSTSSLNDRPGSRNRSSSRTVYGCTCARVQSKHGRALELLGEGIRGRRGSRIHVTSKAFTTSAPQG